MTTHRYCTFHVAGLLVGIEVSQVLEVVRGLDPTQVPLAHPSVLGLLNLRGQIVTAIDARCRLHLAAAPGSDRVNVIIRSGDELMSLVVDRAGDVLDLDAATREEVPETISPTIRSFVSGAYQLESALLLILDTDSALSPSAA